MADLFQIFLRHLLGDLQGDLGELLVELLGHYECGFVSNVAGALHGHLPQLLFLVLTFLHRSLLAHLRVLVQVIEDVDSVCLFIEHPLRLLGNAGGEGALACRWTDPCFMWAGAQPINGCPLLGFEICQFLW